MCPHYTFTQNLFTTHTYLTFPFSLINTDGRNAAVDPRWGRVIHQTLPSLAFLAPPIQEGSGNQTRFVVPSFSYKNGGEGLGERVTCVTSGRREGTVDVRGAVPDEESRGPSCNILSKNLRL